ncbi:MAG TPA: sugar kinase [Acidimicrobiaceae bacterium]|nr:sugar kinase [Acidimicrobiaceae bacterium]
MKGAGDTRLLRLLNGQRIVDVMFDAAPGGFSRAHIARVTGLSKPTVSSLVGDLEAAGLVRRSEAAPPSRALPAGRPAVMYEVVPESGFVVAADIGATKIIVGVADLLGNVVAEQVLPTGPDAQSAVRTLATTAHEMLAELGGTAGAACVGVPGIYRSDTDRVERALNLPGFAELDVSARLVELLGVTVHVDNDVNLAALGEAEHADDDRDATDFAAISVGTGIGMGLIVDGEMYRGGTGAAGEIGSLILRAVPGDPGSVLTLEDVVAASAIRKDFGRALEAGHSSALAADADVPEILAAAALSDPAATAVLTDAAGAMATAVACLALVTDPQRVVLGGGIGANPVFVQAINDELRRRSAEHVEVVASTLGPRAAFLGAVSRALRDLHDTLVAVHLGDNR